MDEGFSLNHAFVTAAYAAECCARVAWARPPWCCLVAVSDYRLHQYTRPP
jgi:hypothetical protein